jgi:uncharacterized membrane protein YfcA
MEWITVAVLVGAGLAAGFVAGLIGLGGGVVFAPVLLLFFRQRGVPPELISKLTAGSSLLCTLVAAGASAWFQTQKNAVAWRAVGVVGVFSAAAVVLVTRFVTTQPWYDQAAFQVVFSALLLVVVARMVAGSGEARSERAPSNANRRRVPLLAGTGAAAGSIATAAGVGGGVVLVPAYARFPRMPMHRAVGTSSATIVLISATGVVSYAAAGWGTPAPGPLTLGYVDAAHALLLAGPAALSARLGVYVAHRIRTRALEVSFAAVALVVVARMLYGALG